MMHSQSLRRNRSSVSYLIVILVVAVEALNLVLLWTALRANIARAVRPLVAGGGLSGAWGAWILVFVLHAPLDMLILTGVVFGISSVVMGIAIHLATVEPDDGQRGGGGGAPTVSPEGPSGGEDDDLAWWPEFQRDVAAYVADQDREHEREDREHEREPQPVGS